MATLRYLQRWIRAWCALCEAAFVAKPCLALGLSLLSVVLTGSPHARADDSTSLAPRSPPATTQLPAPPAPAPARKSPGVTWYGWETLTFGGVVSYGVPLALLREEPVTALVLGAALSPLFTLTIHMVHGDKVKGYVSLGASYAMIAGGGVLGWKVACGSHVYRGCAFDGAVTGIILGGASAVVLDAVALAWGGPPVDEPPARKAVLWPSVVPLPGGVSLGVGGTF